MKKILITAVAFISTFTFCFSQDLITKKNGDELKVKITEVLYTEVKYKLFDNQNGPTYSLLKTEIFMILFENGKKEVFNMDPLQPTSSNNSQLSDAGRELIKFKNHYYTGIGLAAGGIIVQIVGIYSSRNSYNSTTNLEPLF